MNNTYVIFFCKVDTVILHEKDQDILIEQSDIPMSAIW